DRSSGAEVDREVSNGLGVFGFDDRHEVELTEGGVLSEHFAAEIFHLLVDAQDPIGIGVQCLATLWGQSTEQDVGCHGVSFPLASVYSWRRAEHREPTMGLSRGETGQR